MKVDVNIIDKKMNDKLLYKDVNISLQEGIYILQGENGCGKSTLFNILYKLESYNGEILIDNKELSIIDTDIYRSNICSYITQKTDLFKHLTLKENIEVLNLNLNKLDDLLDMLYLKDIYESKTIYKKFSGGEKKKSQILINLLKDTNIILMDEPENNLDEESILNLIKYLNKLNKIIIISSHSLDEFIDLDNYNSITIKNNNIEMNMPIKNQINITLDNKESKKLNSKGKKLLLRNNNLNRVLITLVCIISIFLLFISIATLSSTLENLFGSIDRGKYDDTSIEIYSPVKNYLYTPYGNEDWIKTTPFYFTDKDLNKLKSDPRIKEVIPIPERECGLCNQYTPELQNKLGPNFKLEELDYNKYKIEKDKNTGTVANIQYQDMLISKELSEKLPYNQRYSMIDEIIYGDFPTDNTNGVMIDSYYAMYLANRDGYTSIEDLIGKEVNFETSDNVTSSVINTSDYKTQEKFKITGIYKPKIQYKESIQQSYVIGAYNPEHHIVYRNSLWLMNENKELEKKEGDYGYEDAIYDKYTSIYSQHNLKQKSKIELDTSINYYPGFYIELNDSNDMKSVVQEIEDYDKYIEIGSKYSNQHSNIGRQLSSNIRHQVIQIIIILIIELILVYIILKLYFKEININLRLLKFYGFDKRERKKYIQKDMKVFNLMLYVTIFIIISLLVVNAYISYEWMFAIVNIVILAILMSLIKIMLYIMKRRENESK